MTTATECKIKRRLWQKHWLEKVLADPVRRSIYRQGKRRNFRRWLDRVRCDPVRNRKFNQNKIAQEKRRKLANPEKYRRLTNAVRRRQKKNESRDLRDQYIRGLLTNDRKSGYQSWPHIPPEIINLKRTQLQLTRLIKQKTTHEKTE